MTTETRKLSVHASAPFFWRPWVVGWAIVALVVAGLLWNDASADTWMWRATRWCMGSQDAYQWEQYKVAGVERVGGEKQTGVQAPWYRTMEPPWHGRLYGRTEKLWRILRDMGEPYMTVLLMAVVGIYDRRRWRAAVMLLVSVLAAGGAGVAVGYMCGRLRPDGVLLDGSGHRLLDAAGQMVRNEGGNYWYFLRGFTSFGSAADLSFPSGHATLAFATAAVLSYFSPRGRCLFLVLAGGCARARVVMQAHFYSDVIFGAALGYTLGTVAVRGLDRVLGARKMQAEVE